MRFQFKGKTYRVREDAVLNITYLVVFGLVVAKIVSPYIKAILAWKGVCHA